jgi:hypothetical protein
VQIPGRQATDYSPGQPWPTPHTAVPPAQPGPLRALGRPGRAADSHAPSVPPTGRQRRQVQQGAGPHGFQRASPHASRRTDPDVDAAGFYPQRKRKYSALGATRSEIRPQGRSRTTACCHGWGGHQSPYRCRGGHCCPDPCSHLRQHWRQCRPASRNPPTPPYTSLSAVLIRRSHQTSAAHRNFGGQSSLPCAARQAASRSLTVRYCSIT